MTINKIEVSVFPFESALFKYPIKRPTIIFEKRLILAWRVTYGMCKYSLKLDMVTPHYYFWILVNLAWNNPILS